MRNKKKKLKYILLKGEGKIIRKRVTGFNSSHIAVLKYIYIYIYSPHVEAQQSKPNCKSNQTNIEIRRIEVLNFELQATHLLIKFGHVCLNKHAPKALILSFIKAHYWIE